jgi:hypothetical protein
MILLTVKVKSLDLIQKYRVDIFIIAVLILFFALLFKDALFGGRYILIGDPFKQLYPIRMVAWDMLREGTLPRWTPLILSGYPLLSMVMLGIGYPITWGYLFLPGYWAEQIYILAPYLLSSVFTYAFLRQLNRSHIASLLGGLVYGYGGFLLSPIGLTGVHANSALWLPLVLIGVERAQRRSFLSSLLLSTVAYTMSILAGSGQIFVYVGLLALAYAAFLGLFPDNNRAANLMGWFAWRRWRPLAVISGAMILSAGLAAFQILETWASVKMSVRRVYPYTHFSEGSFSLELAYRALLEPLGNYWDSSTYTPLLAVGLAVVAIISASLRPRLQPQIFFWVIVAVMAWLLILGANTPLFAYYSRLPFVGRFRYPSRHSMEWTFAIGVLAAYGWDVVCAPARKSAATRRPFLSFLSGTARANILFVVLAGALLLLCGGLGVYWWRYTVQAGLDRISDINNGATPLQPLYLAWKGVFTLSIIISLWLSRRITNGLARTVLLAGGIALYCFVEPYIWLISPIVKPLSVTARHFDSFGGATRFLQKHLNEQGRNFSLIHPYSVDQGIDRGLDTVNWTALAGIQDLNGYESLIMERYSLALNRSFGGGVNAEPIITADPKLFEPKSHVLDLLNTQFVTSYSNLSFSPDTLGEKDGIRFKQDDLSLVLRRDESITLEGGDTEADTLALVTAMLNSGLVEDREPVARVSIHTTDGRVIERHLLAGVDTSESAYDRPDVKANIRHSRAPIYYSAPGDPQNSFRAHQFFSRMSLGKPQRIERVEITQLTDTAAVVVLKASLFDSITGRSGPLPELSPKRWQKVYEQNGATVLKNLRALPRAWLVAEAEALDKSEILQRIRGESKIHFDPRATALVEIEPRKLPALPGGTLSEDSYARIVTYEPGHMVVETKSNKPAMLVVSEMHYPGWLGTLDGVKTTIHQTNFLLRGLFIPAGTHTVKMVYRAPGARNGAIISLATILLMAVFIAYVRRRRGAAATAKKTSGPGPSSEQSWQPAP